MGLEQYLIPQIGSVGYFKIQAPFETPEQARFTCQGIRRISEYVGNNEDPFELIYKPKGLTENDYDADVDLDMPIVALQSEQGYWHYFPVRCLLQYPDTNGVPYHGIGIYVNLPAMPVERDLSHMTAEIQALVEDGLGVDCVVELTETSQVALVPVETHDLEQVTRNMRVQSNSTPYARIRTLETANAELLTKVAALETYIKDNM